MNILFTTTGHFEDPEHKLLVQTFRDRKHIIEPVPMERLTGYLKFDPMSQRAAVDAILCKADTDPEGGAAYTLPRALKLAADSPPGARVYAPCATDANGNPFRSS